MDVQRLVVYKLGRTRKKYYFGQEFETENKERSPYQDRRLPAFRAAPNDQIALPEARRIIAMLDFTQRLQKQGFCLIIFYHFPKIKYLTVLIVQRRRNATTFDLSIRGSMSQEPTPLLNRDVYTSTDRGRYGFRKIVCRPCASYSRIRNPVEVGMLATCLKFNSSINH